MAKKSSTVSKIVKKDKRQPAGDPVIRVRELAWTGGHIQAIETASQALAASKTRMRPAVQMDLLDLRAESYIAQGKLDLAAKDANAMIKLAKSGSKLQVAGLQVQALNRKALVQMRTGALKAAVKTASTAAGMQHVSPNLHAQSLLRLSEALFRTRQSDAAIKNSQKAIPLFQAAGDPSGAGRTYWAIAFANLSLGRAEDALHAAQAALELCQSADDQYGIGNAFNALSLTCVDIAERVRHLQRALQAFEIAGYSERQATVLTNLGLAYFELGLYPRAFRLQREVVEMSRRIGAKVGLTYAIGNMMDAEVLLGALDAARVHSLEMTALVSSLGDPNMSATFAQNLGSLAMAEGNPRAAARHYRSAAQIARQNNLGGETVYLTQLGKAYLAYGAHAAAAKAAKQATDIHRSQSLAKPDAFPSQEIWWRYTQALLANNKTQAAHKALEQAHDLLLKSIVNLRDEGLRRNYLNKVAANRELLQFWVKDGAKRNLPKEKILAHLAVESNAREPFKRLTDTSLRLNALRTAAEIQTFLVEEAAELSGGERVLLIYEKDGKRAVTDSILPRGEDTQKLLRSLHPHLTHARLMRAVQLILPKKTSEVFGNPRGLSRIVAPLITQNQVLGYLYADMGSLYGTFTEVDRDMLGMLANQAAVALDNVQWAQGLEQKVLERTEELEERVNELQIINSIQQGLAAEMDFQSIVDMIGDKLREVFKTPDLGIRWHDQKNNLVHYLYEYEHGQRITIPSRPPNPGGLSETMIKTRKPIVFHTPADYGDAPPLPGTDQSKSLVSVPIISSDRVLGSILLESYERENAYGESELRLLTTIAASLGTALENARLFDETQRLLKETEQRAEELLVINSISQALANDQLNFDSSVRLIGEKLGQLFRAQYIYVSLYNQAANRITFPYFWSNGQRVKDDTEFFFGGGVTSHVLRTRQPLLINSDAERQLSELGAVTIAYSQALKSSLIVPILANEQAIGTLALQSSEYENLFTESDVRLMMTIASNIGVSLQNARLFNETQRLLQETEQRAAELAIINSVGESMSRQLDAQTITRTVGDKVTEIFKADATSILMLDAKTNMIQPVFEWDEGKYIEDVESFPLGTGLTSRVIQSRQPLVLGTAEAAAALGAYYPPEAAEVNPTVTQSYLGVPIIVGEHVIGVVSVHTYTKYAYTQDSVRLLSTLANNMGVALENARLFDETQRRAAELQFVNEIGQMLTEELDLKTMIERVGDKLRQSLNLKNIGIGLYKARDNLMQAPYVYRDGKRTTVEPFALNDFNVRVSKSGRSMVVNKDAERRWKKMGGIAAGAGLPKAFVMVPLLAGKEMIGGISILDFEKEDAFANLSISLLETIASNMGTAIQNARLFDETQRLLKETEERNAELAILNTVGEAMAKALDVKTVTHNVGDKVRKIFNAEITNISMFDPKTRLVQLTYSYYGRYFDNEPPWELGKDGLTAKVINTRQPLLLRNTREINESGAQAYVTAAKDEKDPQSYMGVPIMVGEKVLGVVDVQSVRPNAFNENNLRLLQTLSSNMGIALENARLFDETNRLLKETEQRNAELAIINNISQALASELELQAVVDLVGDKLRETFNTQDVFICLYDHSSNLLEFPYSYTLGVRDNQTPLKLGQGLTSHVIATRTPLIINRDFQTRASEFGVFIRDDRDLKVKAWMGVPVIVSDRVIGIIGLANLKHENVFFEQDVRLLETLASNMGVAIQNARLFQAEKQRIEELAIINSIGQTLTQDLNLRSLVDLAGDKLRAALQTENIGIGLYNKSTNLLDSVYVYKNGERVYPELTPLNAFSLRLARQGKSLVLNQVNDEMWKKFGSNLTFGRDIPRAVIMIPILTGGELIGGITLQSFKDPNAYPDSTVRMLETIASNMGTAIQNARLFAETQRLLKETEKRAQELSAIGTVSRVLVTESELETMIHLIGNQLREIFDADIVYIALLDPQTKTIYFPYQYGEAFVTLSLGEGFTGRIIRTGEPLLINKDIGARVKEIGTKRIGKEALSYLGVPIKAGRDTIGVISVQSTTREGVFNNDALRLLTTIAANTGSAIHTAQLHAETQRRARETATLAEVGRDISSSLDASTVLEGIASHAKELLQGNLSALFLPEEDGSTFRAIAAVGEDAEKIRDDIISLGDGILGNIAKNKIGEIVNDANNDMRAITIAGTENLPNEHMLIVPLLANAELKGLMAVWRTGKGLGFTGFELEFLNNLARQAVIAVQNAQLFSEAQELRIAAEQASQAKSAFLANMSHELRTPLTAIIGFTRIVRRKAEGALPKKQTENLDKVLSSAEHLLGLINTVLDIAKIEAGRMDVISANFNLGALVDQCANLAAPLLRPTVALEKQVAENIGIIHSDQDKIKQIVLNLLSNAAKFTHAGKIILGMKKVGTDVHIFVTDSGIGINEEALGRVFEEFQQADTSTTRKYGGTGLGLSISRNLARLLGGDLTAVSEPGKGSTFTLIVPVHYKSKFAFEETV